MKKIRYKEIDLLKGYGIVLMILGHIPVNSFFMKTIYLFHMPLFFIASGFLFKKSNQSISELLKKWFLRLILPYFIFSLCGYALWVIEIKPQIGEELIKPLLAILLYNNQDMPITGALWFLSSMLFLYILYYYIFRFIKTEIWRAFMVSGIVLCGYILNYYKIVLPWSIGIGMIGAFFFYIGHLVFLKYHDILRCLERNTNKSLPYLLCVTIIIITYLGIYNGKINMRIGDYGHSFIVFVLVASILTILYLILFNLLIQKGSNYFLLVIIEKIGVNSIIYLGLNEVVINLIASISGKFGIRGFSYKVFCFFACILFIQTLIKVLKKNKNISNLLQIR